MLLLMLMPVCALTSCGDDDDGPSSNESIVGVWRDVDYNNFFVTFKKDGHFIYDYGGGYTEDGTYRIKGNVLSFVYPPGEEEGDEGEVEEYTILTLTDTRLVLQRKNGVDGDDHIDEYIRVE